MFNIPDHEKLKKMRKKELVKLASDIRAFLIEKVSKSGGHLASNLGVVELTLALFSAFDFPQDKVIFDVGHQSYTYKILTGRAEGFDHLREYSGLSGFPKRHESPYDSFDTGHSSTSISAGLGLVKARDLKHENYHVVSVIGDGSLTGGLAFEGLNNAARLNTNYIIILNDNNMSISENVGGVSSYLNDIRSNEGYNRAKEDVKKAIKQIPGIGDHMVKRISDTKDSLKEIVLPSGMIFENMGITYLGPVDGHDILEMKRIFRKAKRMNRTVLIHVITEKGHGYPPAVAHPERFHGVNSFDVATGKPLKKKTGPTWSDVFGRFMVQQADRYPDVVGITAAMSDNVGLRVFEKKFPERFFDVGIEEEHAVTFAAGLAVGGLHPVFAVFSSFLQRSYDQILHDVCIQNLPVVFAIDRAGIVGRDGETHQGAFDIAYLRSMPNMTLMAPKNAKELSKMLHFACAYRGPVAIRYPRGEADLTMEEYDAPIQYGKAEVMIQESDVLLLAFGDMVRTAMEVHDLLKQQGVSSTVVDLRFAKPWDTELLEKLSSDHSLLVTMEDGAVKGGIGEEIAAYTLQHELPLKVMNVGIPDCFVTQGDTEVLKKLLEMDAESITEKILKHRS